MCVCACVLGSVCVCKKEGESERQIKQFQATLKDVIGQIDVSLRLRLKRSSNFKLFWQLHQAFLMAAIWSAQ